MTATSKSSGHDIRYDEKTGNWFHKDGKGVRFYGKPCKHCGKSPVPVRVKIPADLSSTGKTKWKYVFVDACIASIVKALQKEGVDMRNSCCGHGKNFGEIELQDSRILLIIRNHKKDYWRRYDEYSQELKKDY